MTDQEPPLAHEARRISTKQAAELLGVKPETVYAYVSRGQLSSRRSTGGRGSTFDTKEVEALARRNRREPAESSPAAGMLSVRTRITLIDKDRYYFRGVDATELATRHSYEEVAEWLWTGVLRPGATFTAPEASVAVARRAVDALPEHTGPTDRLRVAAIAAATADPLRFDLSEQAVLGTARTLIPTLVDALPPKSHGHRDDSSLAHRLWARLSGREADEASLRALDTALALLVDHDLAASTLAVRVAASARAHTYAAVSAGLGVLEGPLHGAASGLAHRMLLDVLDRGTAAPVVADELRAGRRVPGLGHRIYPGEDPRARAVRPPGGRSPRRPRPGRGPRRRGHHGPPRTPARQRRPGPRRPHGLVRHARLGGRDDLRRGPHGRLDRPCAGGVRRGPAAHAPERTLRRRTAPSATSGAVTPPAPEVTPVKSG